MFTPRRNNQASYTPLPLEPAAQNQSSFYHYHYPDDVLPTSSSTSSSPPSASSTPRGENKEKQYDKTSTLTGNSHLSFDIFQADGKSNGTIKMQTKEERAHLLQDNEAMNKGIKKPANLRMIYLITIAELVVFAVSIYKNGGFEPFSVNPMIGPSFQVLLELGANYDQKILDDGQWWRFITPIFLHAGLIHLLFNLMFQIQQGVPLEREFGSLRIVTLYMVAGITGNLMSSIFLPTVLSVGASGALFGLMGTLLAAMLKNWKNLRRPCLGIIFLSVIIAFNLFIGLLPYIDNFAHVGGLLAGFLFGLALIPSQGRSTNSFVNGVFACFGFMTAAIGIGAGFYIFYTRVDIHNWCTWCKYIDCLPVMGWCDVYD